jgi:hypothetical protein
MDFELLNKSIQEACNNEFISREFFNEELIYPRERDFLLNEAVDFVNEAFVGKTPLLQEIEDQIGVIRGKLDRYEDWDSHPEVQKLNRLFEKQFGMDVFALHMDPHKVINAYTMVLCRTFDLAGKIDYSKVIQADRKDGFKFKPGNNFCISAVVFWGLMGNPNLTDGEVLAIILHEIGHNFADFIDGKIRLANASMMEAYKQFLLAQCILLSMTIILAPYAIYKYKKQTKQFTNDYRYDKEVDNQDDYHPHKAKREAKKAKREDFWSNLHQTISRYNPINRILAKSSIRTRDLYRGELTKSARESLDRRNEIIADKFAGVYGYGPELATALDKMGQVQTTVERWTAKLPGGEKVNRTWEELYKDITEFDCHPHNIQRINENIKLLKDELKQDEMDPKMKKVILDQISQLESIVKDISTRVNKDPNNISAAYAAFVNEELPDATTYQIEEEITDNFNKMVNKK